MFDQDKHKVILVKIIKQIYADSDLRSVLGFKGGTAAFLFYDLPRLSVDLDFDLLDLEKEKVVLKKVAKILAKFGKVDDARNKRFTLFFLLSYQSGERKVKVEISKRKTQSRYSLQSYLGIPVLVIRKEDMSAGKLAAFLERRKFASRDLFDLWFFLENDWGIRAEILKDRFGYSLKEALERAIKKVETIKERQLLQGLGELLDEKQKMWVKKSLKKDLKFLLKLYLKEKTG